MGIFTSKQSRDQKPIPISSPVFKSSSHYHVNETKKKSPHIPSKIRNDVWKKYHGESKYGVCYCCGKIIERYNKGWHCSHVIARGKGGSISIDNLRTCCPHCNLSMGDQNLYTYIRNKGLKGPGSRNVKAYLERHDSQIYDKRCNNWGSKK